MNHKPLDETRSFRNVVGRDDGNNCSASIEDELADVFDRYPAALDSGDDEGADAILAEYPAIGDEFRAPLRGLYYWVVPPTHMNLVCNIPIQTDAVVWAILNLDFRWNFGDYVVSRRNTRKADRSG